ncbi:site-specific DNA-methyltransferase [Gilliamella sp. Imp1-1]|uniref:site-specific DNA-methyltransferase n=1 Tax=Gilliamella sp. Imp1-1 TaxID=3120248 RepID=UPI000461DE1C|nr:site-specific DNA-methyltransferase [Gilliamella apicola]KDN11155.1 Type III restriction-modification system methylation subunit [Gilliamella apicola]OCG51279.1 hypothetical protein A9G38_06265 [Gilliamella apicola]
MDKLKMHSLNKVDENIKKIGAQFPNCITERKNQQGEVEYAIDFDMLKQELSSVIVEGREERYQFTWPDKKKSILLANAPIAKTLRPCREESVDFDDTENLYIEGDNLEVLKLLQETYLDKVDLIFIDPPYNTGHDFMYLDNFIQSYAEYIGHSNQYDLNGNRLIQNIESNGRFHTDWLNMMYPRLKIAKDILKKNGIIFITLDDNENYNARKLCNEIFGEKNFIAEFIWEKKKKPSFLHRNVGKIFDYVLCYAKQSELTVPFSIEKTTEGKKYPINNAGNNRSTITLPPFSVDFSIKEQIFEPQDMSEGNIITKLLNRVIVENYKNITEIILEGEWRYSQSKIDEIVQNQEKIVISKAPFRPNHIKLGGEIKKMKNVLSPNSYSCETNEDGLAQIRHLFGGDIFDTPKPEKLIQILLQATLYKQESPIIMDFFSGSATTAAAVMDYNVKQNKSARYILVQMPEDISERNNKFAVEFLQKQKKATNICEIGKERIRRAGNKIAQENPQAKFDKGFRVLKCDSSNMKEVYYNPAEYNTDLLDVLIDNIKADRTAEDLLFQVMLDLGVLLSSDIKQTSIAGKTVFNVADNFLMACFDTDINEEVITAIAKQKPYYFVMRDSSMENDSVATNFEQIFNTYSPETKRKVL